MSYDEIGALRRGDTVREVGGMGDDATVLGWWGPSYGEATRVVMAPVGELKIGEPIFVDPGGNVRKHKPLDASR